MIASSHNEGALPPLEHVATLTDDVGIIQHAVETVPNRSTGYCTDDVARAFIVALMRLRLDSRDERAMRFASTYLSFLESAQLGDGRFHNFMSYERAWLDDVGTQDSCGRATWALGYGATYAPTEPWRRVCKTLFERALGAIDDYTFLRPRAYAILGLAHAWTGSHAPAYATALRHLAGVLGAAYDATRDAAWAWYEDEMTYDNARLPEAMIRAGAAVCEPRFVDAGLASLAFYEGVTLLDGAFVPIGNQGWYRRGGPRAIYVQQPLEALSMIDAESAAFDATGDVGRLDAARIALAWYYGKNTRGQTMAQPGGGCFDGLGETAVNRNMGAESTLALLAGAYAMADRRKGALRAVR